MVLFMSARPAMGTMERKQKRIKCSGKHMLPPRQQWRFAGWVTAQDVTSLRRGWEVFKGVCYACHSADFTYTGYLTDTVYPEKRVKEICATLPEVKDIASNGEEFLRPILMTDNLPRPFPNEQAAAYANGGAKPPDLSFPTWWTYGQADYVYSLLCGYVEPPEGVSMRTGLYYNPYMLGGAIAMPAPLNDGVIEYEDGTPASVPQMAYDSCCFFVWCCDPGYENLMMKKFKAIAQSIPLICLGIYSFKTIKGAMKSQRLDFVRPRL